MTDSEAKNIAIAFMQSRPDIAPWAFSRMKFTPGSDGNDKSHWTVIFDPQDPEWKGHVCFIVDVDDETGIPSSFPTL